MDPSNLTWSKHLKSMHSMSLSMPPKSLAHLKHVMGHCWCLWTDPYHPLSLI